MSATVCPVMRTCARAKPLRAGTSPTAWRSQRVETDVILPTGRRVKLHPLKRVGSIETCSGRITWTGPGQASGRGRCRARSADRRSFANGANVALLLLSLVLLLAAVDW